MDISLTYAEAGVTFSFPVDTVLPLIRSEPPTPLAQDLELLWAEGLLVQRTSTDYLLANEHVYSIGGQRRKLLGIPEPIDDLSIRVESEGIPGRKGFHFKMRTRSGSLGVLKGKDRTGIFVETEHGPVLLPANALPLVSVLDNFHFNTAEESIILTGRVKEAAINAGASMDGFLRNEDIVVASGFEIEANYLSPTEMEINVVIPTAVAEYPDLNSPSKPVRGVYTAVDKSSRKRLVLPNAVQESVKKVREVGKLKGKDAVLFLDNPEAFLPESFDLSRYGYRVKGLVPLVKKVYPRVRFQGEGEWFSLSFNEEKGKSDVIGNVQGTPTERGDITPEEYAGLCKEVLEDSSPYVQHGDEWLRIEPNEAQKFIDVYDKLEKQEDGKYKAKPGMGKYVLDIVTNVSTVEYAEQLGEMNFLKDLDYSIPTSLAATLMTHQVRGYAWLRFLWDKQAGGILADDMGVGKTMQIIALLSYLNEAKRLTPTLIVLPLTLCENWKREIAKFAPSLGSIYEHRGPYRSNSIDYISQQRIVITSYDTLRSDQLLLARIDWKVVICDEAQNVKNSTAQRTSAVKALKCRLRIAATGTPVENTLTELWCLMDFANPGKLGSQTEFDKEFTTRLVSPNIPIEEKKGIVTDLQTKLFPTYLRRQKEDILSNLPTKTPHVEKVPMSALQLSLYTEVIERVQAGKIIPIAALQRMLALLSHPEQIRDEETINLSAEHLLSVCPKLQYAMRVLESVKEKNERLLMFSKHYKMQKILQTAVAHCFGIHAPVLNGSITQGRQAFVDTINNAKGFDVLILSPEVAGVGLTITGANHAMHYERLWNPAKEAQATDRIYRIGQTRDVHIYYPIVCGNGFLSAEERLNSVLKRKQDMAKDVLWCQNLDVSVQELAKEMFNCS